MHVLKRRCSFEGIGHHARQDNNVFTDFDLVVQGVQEGFEILWVLLWVNGGDDLEEHHLSRTKQSHGRFPTLARIALFGSDDGKVMESSFKGQMDALDVPVLKLENWGELTANRFSEVSVLHWWEADDGGW